MSQDTSPIDVDRALLDPTSIFAGPEDVFAANALDRDTKIEILRRWGYDALELEVAEEENMTGGEPDILDRIVRALLSMGVEPDLDHRPPTKQGGI
jgi:hypothetical protein